MNNKLTVPGIAAVAALIIGFGAGYFIPHGASAAGKGQFGMMQNGSFAGRTSAGAGTARGMNGAVVGQILSADSGSITVKMQDGSTKIVLISTSTPIFKTSAGSAADLTAGTEVMAAGSPNSDGSITAQSIQIRPAGSGAGYGMMMFRTGASTQGQ